jgi:hypothetical protein
MQLSVGRKQLIVKYGVFDFYRSVGDFFRGAGKSENVQMFCLLYYCIFYFPVLTKSLPVTVSISTVISSAHFIFAVKFLVAS